MRYASNDDSEEIDDKECPAVELETDVKDDDDSSGHTRTFDEHY